MARSSVARSRPVDRARDLAGEMDTVNPNDPDLGAFRRFLQRQQRLFRGRRRTD